MRVLFVTNMWPDEQRPWYGSFVYSQARSLRELGFELDVLAIRGYASKWQYATAAQSMIRRALRGDHDLVHAHYGYSAVIGRLDPRRPLVISYCGADLLGTSSPKRPARMTRGSLILARAFAQLSRVADATITKSRQMELELPRSARRRNHVIPNGVDLQMFRRTDQASARARLGWPVSEKVALFVGDPAKTRKNFPLAERAVAQAARVRPDLRLRVANDVAPEDVPIWMSAADALIHPSWSEGSPNTVKEAMACELPVVATAVGDVSERLHGVAGCHAPAPNAAAFADAVLDAIEHHPCPAARTAVADVALSRVAERVAAVYESVTRRPGR